MRRLTILATMCTLALGAALPMAPSAQQADALKAAADTLGAAKIKTLQFTGSGANFSVGQNYTPSEPWPRVTVKSYTASINYDTGSMRLELRARNGDGRCRAAAARRSPASSGRFRSSAATTRGTCRRGRARRAAAAARRAPRRQRRSSACSRSGRRRRAS